MTQDLNKGISRIQYNSLNLPQQMDIKSPVAEAKNEYTYSASGQKLRVFQKWNPTFNSNPLIGSTVNEASMTSNKTTDYVGNFIYENGVRKRILVDGGYIENWMYYFYLTDHLGNNRVVADTDANIIQSSDYHAFGQPFDSNEGQEIQPDKYNGKELDNMHGLNMYDYAARYMDPAIGRFSSVDPLAEKYYSISPYAYVGNNPLNAIDPRGDSIWYTIDNNNVSMHVQAKVINRSGDNINMMRAAKDIASGISKAFDGKFDANGRSYTMKTNVDVSSVSSMSDVAESDHLFVLSDRIEPADIPGRAATNEDGGKVMSIWAGDYANDNALSNKLSYNNTRSAIHEFGHGVGLSHESASGYRNLMSQRGGGINITSEQRASMLGRYGRGHINKGGNSYMNNGIRQPINTYRYFDTNLRSYKTVGLGHIGLKHKY